MVHFSPASIGVISSVKSLPACNTQYHESCTIKLPAANDFELGKSSVKTLIQCHLHAPCLVTAAMAELGSVMEVCNTGSSPIADALSP